jgi:two-component system chemotaxis response regulator CheB
MLPRKNLNNYPENNLKMDPTEDSAANEPPADSHDIIVIGASAGGVEALQKVVRALPGDLPATVFIVMHTSPQSPGLMPIILNAAGPLPVSYPQDGELIQEGHIYVAPTNFHMLVEQGIIRVVRGPKENRHRPAIDPLFRSAARYYGPRVIGLILSGMLDDGTFGLLAVKQRGGLTVVQDPTDALYPDMPANALHRVENVDYVLSLEKIGPLLAKLVKEVPVLPLSPDASAIIHQLKIEDDFAMANIPDFEVLNTVGKPAAIACPDCHGTLWEIKNNEVLRFRCRVGHSYTAQSLLAEHSEALESALYAALRNLEESASLNRRLAGRAKADNNLLSASGFIESALQSEQQADVIKRVLRTNKALDEREDNRNGLL